MFCNSFKIAGITITLKTESPIDISEKFVPFLYHNEGEMRSDYTAVFHQVEKLPEASAIWLHKENAFDIGRDSLENYYRRFRNLMKDEQIYSTASYDWKKRIVEVSYLPNGQSCLNQSDNCFFHIEWETMMQLKRCAILHACAIDTMYGGILFSGKSGAGKSTQGELWHRYEGANVVNGDRTIIKKEGNMWYGYGSPYAGSSRYHKNMRTPIRAVVMLKQGHSNTIRRLRLEEVFRNIYTGLTISTWNPKCVETACDLAIELGVEIPVYEMECTPDKRAVELLKQTLLTEGEV